MPVSCLWNEGDRPWVSFIGGDGDENHNGASNSLEIPIVCRSSLSCSFFKVHTLRIGVRDSKKVCSGRLTGMIYRARLMDGKVILANLASGDFTQQTAGSSAVSHKGDLWSRWEKVKRISGQTRKDLESTWGRVWGEGFFRENSLKHTAWGPSQTTNYSSSTCEWDEAPHIAEHQGLDFRLFYRGKCVYEKLYRSNSTPYLSRKSSHSISKDSDWHILQWIFLIGDTRGSESFLTDLWGIGRQNKRVHVTALGKEKASVAH